MIRPCRWNFSGEKRAGALLIVLFVMALVMLMLMTLLGLMHWQADMEGAEETRFATEELLTGATRAAQAALPDTLPAVGKTVTLFDEALSADNHVAAYLKRDDQHRVSLQAVARRLPSAPRTQTRSYFVVKTAEALDETPVMVYDFNRRDGAFDVWLTINADAPLVLVPPADIAKSPGKDLGTKCEPVGLHVIGPLQVESPLHVRGKLIVDGDLLVKAPIEAEEVFAQGRFSLAGAGHLTAKTLWLKSPEDLAAVKAPDADEAALIEADIRQWDAPAALHYYDLGLAIKEKKWTIKDAGRAS